jgi:hypothetical protein
MPRFEISSASGLGLWLQCRIEKSLWFIGDDQRILFQAIRLTLETSRSPRTATGQIASPSAISSSLNFGGQIAMEEKI